MTDKTTEALKLSLPALENAESVAASINAGKRHAIQVDEETCFWQREEWVRWAIDEVLPEIRQALAAIREALSEHPMDYDQGFVDGVEAQLADPVKQEPVALSFPRDTTSWTGGWTIDYKLVRSVDDAIDDNEFKPCIESVEQVLLALEKVYAAPVSANREWVELTDYEIVRLYAESPMCDSEMIAFARDVIADFKEKNK